MFFGEVRGAYRLFGAFLFDVGSTGSVSPSLAIAVSVVSEKPSVKEVSNES